MSKETLLKREFTEREVQRMRNIVTKKTGERTIIQAGWESQIKRSVRRTKNRTRSQIAALHHHKRQGF